MWRKRLRKLSLRQHPLDPCLFLAFEIDYQEEPCDDGTTFRAGRLCGAICLHVDDMLGAGSPTSKTYMPTWRRACELPSTFVSGRMVIDWNTCGSIFEKRPEGGLRLCQQDYIGKIHPVPVQKACVGPNTDTCKEITQLPGLCGALPWPSVQSSPHLQASTTITSGLVNNGKVSTVTELNGALRFAKQNSDVGLICKFLGDISKLRLVTMFDVSFSVRADGSSQGGYMVMLCHGSLEIRVIKELVEELRGELKWAGSERQWADGLTKISARQLLASRFRHGKIGFYWDPSYIAAKKKSAAERQTPPLESYAYMAYTDDILEYEDVTKSKDTTENAAAILNGMRYYLGTTLGAVASSYDGILPQLGSLLAFNFTWKLVLGLLLLGCVIYMVRKYVDYKVKESYETGYRMGWQEVHGEIRQNRGAGWCGRDTP
eukprot:s1238_g17.t1